MAAFMLGGAAADDRDALAGAGGAGEHLQPVLDAQLGVDGAHRDEGVVGAPAVALVAPQAGHDVLRPVLVDQLAVVRVGDPGPGHADQVQLALGDGPLGGVRVVPAAHGGDEHPGVLGLDVGGHVQSGHLLRGVVGGVVAVGVAGPDLGDVHIGGRPCAGTPRCRPWCSRRTCPPRRRSGSPR